MNPPDVGPVREILRILPHLVMVMMMVTAVIMVVVLDEIALADETLLRAESPRTSARAIEHLALMNIGLECGTIMTASWPGMFLRISRSLVGMDRRIPGACSGQSGLRTTN